MRLHDGARALDTCGGARGKAAKHGLIGCRPIASDRRQLHVESDAAEGYEESDVAARRLISDVGARLDVLEPDVAIYGGKHGVKGVNHAGRVIVAESWWVQSGGVTVKGVRETRRDTQLVCSQLARRFSRTLFGSCRSQNRFFW